MVSYCQDVFNRQTLRAVDLLQLPYFKYYPFAYISADVPSFILDVGCGSGLSGEILTEEGGHMWVGMDIAPSMLGISVFDEFDVV
jgi:18S rRNA (guanine1575-N7)-methyltransferase